MVDVDDYDTIIFVIRCDEPREHLPHRYWQDYEYRYCKGLPVNPTVQVANLVGEEPDDYAR